MTNKINLVDLGKNILEHHYNDKVISVNDHCLRIAINKDNIKNSITLLPCFKFIKAKITGNTMKLIRLLAASPHINAEAQSIRRPFSLFKPISKAPLIF